MEDFQYCVWLSPEAGHPWSSFIPQVEAHLTVQSYMASPVAARNLFNRVDQDVHIRRVGRVSMTRTNGFYALTQAVAPVGCIPEWWPEGAHVSFSYRYQKPYTSEDIAQVEERIAATPPFVRLTQARIVKATGHYRSWAVLDQKVVG